MKSNVLEDSLKKIWTTLTFIAERFHHSSERIWTFASS